MVGQDWAMVETTGGFTSAGLEREAKTLMLASLSQAEALEIGEIAVALGRARKAPIAIEVKMGQWSIFTHRCRDQSLKMMRGLRVRRGLC